MKKKKSKSDEFITYTKVVVCLILLFGELQICASYVLAFMDKGQIAEALSGQVVTVIMGTAIGYFVKALIENLSKHNNFKIGNDRRTQPDDEVCG